MKFETTRPSEGFILGPNVLKILATRTSTPAYSQQALSPKRHRDRNIHLVSVSVHHGFSHSLSLIIACARPDGIDMPPVRLFLGMLSRIAINLALILRMATTFTSRSINLGGRRKEDSSPHTFCQPQHVDCPHNTCLDCFDRIVHVMRWGTGAAKINFEEMKVCTLRWAGQMKNAIDF